MSKTWSLRCLPLTFRVFFFRDTAANDRLLFDFPHNVAGLFIVSQSDKGRVPQVTVWRPLGNSICATSLGFSQPQFFISSFVKAHWVHFFSGRFAKWANIGF